MKYSDRKTRKKQFFDSKSRKELLRKTKYNRRKNRWKNNRSSKYHPVSRSSTGKRHTYPIKAPSRLCVFEETQSTLGYFDEVINTISRCKLGDSIFFDLSAVEIISPDAIMYLIAVIKNMRRIRVLKIKCSGNTPKTKAAQEIIERSGFFEFVASTVPKKVESDSRYMKISDGKDANGLLASSFCDFVQKTCALTSRDTKRLYPMIIELMTNTHQHAYEAQGKQLMLENWYIFAQDTGDAVHFVFLDTGLGIPKTVSKRFYERIKDWISKNDATYLKSALQGDFRSETKQGHRGKGLPGIYEDACNAAIDHLSIISGKAKCTVMLDGTIEAESLGQTFEGTLFAWDILKKEATA